MLNSKDMSNNSPIPKSDKSDSGSSKDFDFYEFTNPFVYYFTVSVIYPIHSLLSITKFSFLCFINFSPVTFLYIYNIILFISL